MRLISIVGARPQFIKAAVVSRALEQEGLEEWLLHTGQHYDAGMSANFFTELDLPEPAVNLAVGSGSPAAQTAAMMTGVEQQIKDRSPGMVLVYGDTNSTLAGALAAVKVGVPVAHVEAGLRSFNRDMPEEHNRVIADHCSSLHFCPTPVSVKNLARENITEEVHLVGDVMYESVMIQRERARAGSDILRKVFGDEQVVPEFLLATVHRPQNTDDLEQLNAIILALNECDFPVVLPLHPRTAEAIKEFRQAGCGVVKFSDSVRVIDPVGYLDMLQLLDGAKAVLTDSGGVQKEAAWLGTPCITLREETEWVETVDAGWNVLVGACPDRILAATKDWIDQSREPLPVVNKTASGEIVSRVREYLK